MDYKTEKEFVDKWGLVDFLRGEELPDLRERVEKLGVGSFRPETKFLNAVIERIIRDIGEFPSVSAVVPVRCRDCIHHRKADGHCRVWNVSIKDNSYYCGDGTKENTR